MLIIKQKPPNKNDKKGEANVNFEKPFWSFSYDSNNLSSPFYC